MILKDLNDKERELRQAVSDTFHIEKTRRTQELFEFTKQWAQAYKNQQLTDSEYHRFVETHKDEILDSIIQDYRKLKKHTEDLTEIEVDLIPLAKKSVDKNVRLTAINRDKQKLLQESESLLANFKNLTNGMQRVEPEKANKVINFLVNFIRTITVVGFFFNSPATKVKSRNQNREKANQSLSELAEENEKLQGNNAFNLHVLDMQKAYPTVTDLQAFQLVSFKLTQPSEFEQWRLSLKTVALSEFPKVTDQDIMLTMHAMLGEEGWNSNDILKGEYKIPWRKAEDNTVNARYQRHMNGMI